MIEKDIHEIDGQDTKCTWNNLLIFIFPILSIYQFKFRRNEISCRYQVS